MWDLPRLAQIQKARNALKAGNLDEAFEIATRAELKDYRQCQRVLENLVDPLLGRAEKHLEEGRIDDALADAEKARRAGGNRPAVAAMRERALGEKHREDLERQQARRALESVRGHIRAGRIEEGAHRLEEAPAHPDGSAQAEDLRQRLERLRGEVERLRDRVESHLERGDLEEAMKAAHELQSAAAEQPFTRELLERIGKEAEGKVAAALAHGDLGRARRWMGLLSGLEVENSYLLQWGEALELSDRASLAMERGDWSGGRVYLGRLQRILPAAQWVALCEEKLGAMEEALRELRASPLGAAASELRGREGAERPAAETLPVAEPKPPAALPAGAPGSAPAASGDRCILWVDGVGSYLLLRSLSVTIGRAGSSAQPDVALPADLEGVHAQILRVDHDYFLVSRGETRINGKKVERHLLADGDAIALGPRCRLTFRLPSRLSSTAILELGAGLRLAGDVRRIILIDGHLIFGPADGSHVAIPRLAERIVLSSGPEGFRCRAPVPLVIDGKVRGKDESVPAGAHVEAGPVTFTLTEATREAMER
ncbi:MAG: hypothetical protein JXA90_03470 [Planctomycetes bacterium]|nr:hypothetical protein [Planctomycetota bacterium]